MASLGEGAEGSFTTISFDAFWSWLLRHPNCIFRAGTPEVALFDDEDLHWHFAADGPNFYVQLMRGKRFLGEMLIEPERISYVQVLGEEREDEFAFELVSESENERYALYYFVLSHGYEDGEQPAAGRTHSVH
jgi:hypothetical protein